jgi:hypothetical protein
MSTKNEYYASFIILSFMALGIGLSVEGQKQENEAMTIAGYVFLGFFGASIMLGALMASVA